jgi:hypothetical protein
VHRVAPHPRDPDLLPPSREAGIFANRTLTFAELDRQFAAGARLVTSTDGREPRTGAAHDEIPLFAVTPSGQLSVASDGRPPDVGPRDSVVVLVRAVDAEPPIVLSG